MSTVKTNDPITLAIDYPDRPVNRLTSFFRWITVIPIGIIALIMIQTLPFFSMGAQYNADEQELRQFFRPGQRCVKHVTHPDLHHEDDCDDRQRKDQRHVDGAVEDTED